MNLSISFLPGQISTPSCSFVAKHSHVQLSEFLTPLSPCIRSPLCLLSVPSTFTDILQDAAQMSPHWFTQMASTLHQGVRENFINQVFSYTI